MSDDIVKEGWTLCRSDPITGVKIWLKPGPEEGTLLWRKTQDADASIAYNAEMEKASQGKSFGDYRLMGSIPLSLYHSSGLAEANEERDEKFVRRWFNDADNAKFRGSRGRF